MKPKPECTWCGHKPHSGQCPRLVPYPAAPQRGKRDSATSDEPCRCVYRAPMAETGMLV